MAYKQNSQPASSNEFESTGDKKNVNEWECLDRTVPHRPPTDAECYKSAARNGEGRTHGAQRDGLKVGQQNGRK